MVRKEVRGVLSAGYRRVSFFVVVSATRTLQRSGKRAMSIASIKPISEHAPVTTHV